MILEILSTIPSILMWVFFWWAVFNGVDTPWGKVEINFFPPSIERVQIWDTPDRVPNSKEP